MNTTSIHRTRPLARAIATLVAAMLALSIVGAFETDAFAASSTSRQLVTTANTSKVTVCFNANGGTGKMTNQTMTATARTTLKVNLFTRTGFSFKGWNTKANGTGKNYANRAVVSNLAKSGTVTLYAQWKDNRTSIKSGWWAIDSKGRKITSAYSLTYTGGYQNPIAAITNGKITIKRPKFTPFIKNNKNVGTAVVLIKGVHNYGYKDYFRVHFTIKPKPVVKNGEYIENGKAYYYKNGVMQRNYIGNGKYYDANGVGKEYATAIFDQYNNFRARKGANRVSWDPYCQQLANATAFKCSQQGKLQHRIAIPGNLQTTYSDILFYGTPGRATPSQVIAKWESSTGHRKMMQNTNGTTKAAVGYYWDGTRFWVAIVYNFYGCNQSGL